MKKEIKNNCCKGCKNGKLGQNKACQARLFTEKLKETKHQLSGDEDLTSKEPKNSEL